jgi:hypothetical protein
MPEEQEKLNYAHIIHTEDAYTVIALSFAGKTLERYFVGVGHHSRASLAVVEWNEHFAAQWATVTDAAASILCIFISMLRLRGVAQEDIDAAFRGAQTYGG